MVRFYLFRLLKDYLGHIILIGLPLVLITLMVSINRNVPGAPPVEEASLYIGLIYILMFQGFGAAYTFEGLEHDFFRPFKDRLLMSPLHPMRFVYANLFFSTLVSYAQSLLLLGYIVLVFGAEIPNLLGVLGILFIAVLFAQLLAALFIFLFKKAARAQLAITIYIIAGMALAGFFVPLPESPFTLWARTYSSPLAWTHHALYGLMGNRFDEVALGLGLLIGSMVVVALAATKLSRSVIS